MEFAENNRISHRQLYRQILLAFTGPFLLCMLGKEGVMGISGIAGTAGAILLLLFYVIFLIRLSPSFGDLKKSMGSAAGRGAGIFFLSYVLLTGAYLLRCLGEIVPKSLTEGIPEGWLSLLALLVCAMGSAGGMQRRGRMAGVSGGVFLGAVLLLLILCAGQGRTVYLWELLEGSDLTGTGVLEGGYRVLCGFSGLGLLPFALEHVQKQGSARKTLMYAVLTLGGILVAMELLLPAVFGWNRLFEQEYPVLPLLAGADLPGNVLARFDIIWIGFLIYSLLFSIGSLLHYGHQIVKKAGLGTGRVWMATGIFLLSQAKIFGEDIRGYFPCYLGYFYVPGLLLIQVFVMQKGRGGPKRKLQGAAAMVALILLLSGCAGVEPEKRLYPLALGVDFDQGFYVFSYGMPNLPKATGQEKTEEGGGEALTIRGKNFQEIEEIYDRTQEKYLDLGHLQILVLGEEIRREGRWKLLMDYLEQEPFVGEDIHAFACSQPQEAAGWQSPQGTSLGEYLEGILENRLPSQRKKPVTLRELYHARSQGESLPELPKLLLGEKELELRF